MSILSAKQGEELRLAIHEYLAAQGLAQSAATLAQEAGLPAGALAAPAPGATSALERKWTAVVRLQRKVLDLEAQVAKLNEALAVASGPFGRSGQANGTSGALLPRAPEAHRLDGHRGTVSFIALHPTQPVAATCGGDDAGVKLWDYEQGTYEKTLKAHTRGVACAAWDNRGKLLATCAADLAVKLYDAEQGFANVKTMQGHDHAVSAIAFLPAPPGSPASVPPAALISAGRDKCVKFWDLTTGFCTATLADAHDEWVRALSVSDDGAWLATASSDQTARIWRIASPTSAPTLKQELRGHSHVVECVAFVPVRAHAFVRELVASVRRAQAMDAGGAVPVGAAAADSGIAPAPAEESAGAYVLTGARDKEVKLWDCATGECLFTFLGHENWVRALAFPPTTSPISARYFATVSDDKALRVWDIATGKCARAVQDAHAHFATAVAFSPLAPAIVTGGVDGAVKVWACV